MDDGLFEMIPDTKYNKSCIVLTILFFLGILLIGFTLLITVMITKLPHYVGWAKKSQIVI